MVETLSEAALDYGRAFCVPESESGVPFTQLPTDQQTCVARVGETWANKVEQKMGGGLPAAIPVIRRTTLGGPQGQSVGTLTFADGAVTLCMTPQGQPGTGSCQVVGWGHDAFDAARQTLQALGVSVHGETSA